MVKKDLVTSYSKYDISEELIILFEEHNWKFIELFERTVDEQGNVIPKKKREYKVLASCKRDINFIVCPAFFLMISYTVDTGIAEMVPINSNMVKDWIKK